jgi:hypothetical protein
VSSTTQVAEIAAAFRSGKLDSLTTIRRILRVVSDVDRVGGQMLTALVGLVIMVSQILRLIHRS